MTQQDPLIADAWLEGDHLAVARSAKLPNVCVKCARTSNVVHRAETLVALPPIEQRSRPLMPVLMSLIGGSHGNGLGATLEIPRCRACHRKWMLVRMIGAASMLFMLGAAALCVKPFMDASLKSSPVVPGLTLLAAFVTLIVIARVVVPRVVVHAVHVTLDHVVLAGVPKVAREKIVAKMHDPDTQDRWYEKGL